MELETAYPKIKICKLNTDEAQEISEKFGINSIPQLLIFYKGHTGIMKAGVKSIPDIIKFIEELISEYKKLPEKDQNKPSEPLLDMNHAPMKILNSNNFEEFTRENHLSLILFYDNVWPPAWIMTQVIKGGGNEFLNEFPELTFGIYEVSEDDKIKAKLGLKMVPQVAISHKRELHFMGPGYRQLEEIAEFIHQVQDSSEKLDDRPQNYLKIIRVDGENWENIHNANPFLFLAFFQGENRDSIRQLLIYQREQDIFTEKYPNLVFAYASADDSPDLMKKFGLDIIPTNLIFMDGLYGQMLPGEKSPTIVARFIEDFQKFVKIKSKDALPTNKPAYIQPELIHHLQRSEFDQFLSLHELVLVDFWASWCGPCQTQGQILEYAAQDLMDAFPSLSIIKVNTDEDEGLSSERYGIDAIPQLVLFFKGTHGFARPGVMEPEELSSFIKEYLELYKRSESNTGCLLPLQKDSELSPADFDNDDSDDDEDNEE